MRYQPLPKDVYIRNRQKLAAHLKPGAAVILTSNDIMPTNGDGSMGFKQNSDLLYLSGIDQEETMLILFPDAHRKEHRAMLFLRETNEEIAIWEGAKFTKEQARELSGIEEVHWLSEYPRLIKWVMGEAACVYLNSNEHLRQSNEVQTREEKLSQSLRATYPHHTYERLAPLMHQLRSVKEPEEIAAIRHACTITRDAFLAICDFVKPGVYEYEIEALLYHEFIRRRSRGPAYDPIIASGPNACVLHYVSNEEVCKAGDVILLDIGAEYANYAADLTRCLPVSGRFTSRQKAVYNAVLSVKEGAKQLLKPGVYLDDYHKQVGQLMEEQLLQLGLITTEDIKKQDPKWPAYKKYFMHGTSHYLGLDVHDVGLWHTPIQAGMVFTVEPGIYIREEGLGIRLENDIVVTETGYDDLMADIPVTAEAIEDLMNR